MWIKIPSTVANEHITKALDDNVTKDMSSCDLKKLNVLRKACQMAQEIELNEDDLEVLL
jgi:hypothetical protein